MKFLIADDDKDLLEFLSMIVVSNYDVAVVKAENGQVAIDLIRSQGPFDLILCDYHMPKKNGAEVYNELRNDYITPFILVSSDIDKFKEQFLEPLNCGFLDKPFFEKQLIQKIEEILSEKSSN